MTHTAVTGWCALCGKTASEWETSPRFGQRALCPNCGSLPRHRLLAEVLVELQPILTKASTVMQLGPSPSVTRHLVERVGHSRYLGLDLGLENRQVDLLGDLTALPLSDNSVDVLVIVHVLEHIPDDAAAMAEIKRVIGDRGVAVLQVPYRSDRPTDEDPSAPRAERVRRFGQADHIRLYGQDFTSRLTNAGLQVAEFQAERDLEPDRVEAGQLMGRLWLVSGDRSDPTNWSGLVASVAKRRSSCPVLPVTIDPDRRIDDLEHEVLYLRRRLSSEHSRARNQARDLSVAQRECVAWQDELETMKTELHSVEGRLEAIRTSRTFRIGHLMTEPARRLRRMLNNVALKQR